MEKVYYSVNKYPQYNDPKCKHPPPSAFSQAYKKLQYKRFRRDPFMQSTPEFRQNSSSGQGTSPLYFTRPNLEKRYNNQQKVLINHQRHASEKQYTNSFQYNDNDTIKTEQQFKTKFFPASQIKSDVSNRLILSGIKQSSYTDNVKLKTASEQEASTRLSPQKLDFFGMASDGEKNANMYQDIQQENENTQFDIDGYPRHNTGDSLSPLGKYSQLKEVTQQVAIGPSNLSENLRRERFMPQANNTEYTKSGRPLQLGQESESSRTQLLSMRHSVPSNMSLLQDTCKEDNASHQNQSPSSFNYSFISNQYSKSPNSQLNEAIIKQRPRRRVSQHELLTPGANTKRTVSDLVALFELRGRNSFKFWAEHNGQGDFKDSPLPNAISLPQNKNKGQREYDLACLEYFNDLKQENELLPNNEVTPFKIFNKDASIELAKEKISCPGTSDQHSQSKFDTKRLSSPEHSENFSPQFAKQRSARHRTPLKEQRLDSSSSSNSSVVNEGQQVRFQFSSQEEVDKEKRVKPPHLRDQLGRFSLSMRRSTHLLTFEEKLQYFTAKDQQLQELLKQADPSVASKPGQDISNQVNMFNLLQKNFSSMSQREKQKALDSMDQFELDQIEQGYYADESAQPNEFDKGPFELSEQEGTDQSKGHNPGVSSESTPIQQELPNFNRRGKNTQKPLSRDTSIKNDSFQSNMLTNEDPSNSSKGISRKVNIPLLDLDKVNGLVINSTEKSQKGGWRSLYNNYSITSHSNSREQDSTYRSPFYKQYNTDIYQRLYPSKSTRLPYDRSVYYLKQKSLDSRPNSDRGSYSQRNVYKTKRSTSDVQVKDFPIYEQSWQDEESPKYSQIYTNNTFLDTNSSPDNSGKQKVQTRSTLLTNSQPKGSVGREFKLGSSIQKRLSFSCKSAERVINELIQMEKGLDSEQEKTPVPDSKGQQSNRNSNLGKYLTQLQSIIDSSESQINQRYDSVTSNSQNLIQAADIEQDLVSPQNAESPLHSNKFSQSQPNTNQSTRLSTEFTSLINNWKDSIKVRSARGQTSRSFGFDDLIQSGQESIDSPFAEVFKLQSTSQKGNQLLHMDQIQAQDGMATENIQLINQVETTYTMPQHSASIQLFQQINLIDDYFQKSSLTFETQKSVIYPSKNDQSYDLVLDKNEIQFKQLQQANGLNFTNNYLLTHYPPPLEYKNSMEGNDLLDFQVNDYLVQKYPPNKDFKISFDSQSKDIAQLQIQNYLSIRYPPQPDFKILLYVPVPITYFFVEDYIYKPEIQFHTSLHSQDRNIMTLFKDEFLDQKYIPPNWYEVKKVKDFSFHNDYLDTKYKPTFEQLFKFSINGLFIAKLYGDIHIFDEYIQVGQENSSLGSVQLSNINNRYINTQSPIIAQSQ